MFGKGVRSAVGHVDIESYIQSPITSIVHMAVEV